MLVKSTISAGIWVTKKYKSLRPRSTTKFIAFSGDKDENVRQLCKDAGMIPPYLLCKPMDQDAVAKVLDVAFTVGQWLVAVKDCRG